ncbi:MAG: hypothetical protein WD048_03360 [Chitinophagales bacterium]
MDLSSRKIEFIKEFLKLQSEDSIYHFEQLLKKELDNNGDLIEPMSLDSLNDRIDQSMEDSYKGKHTEAKDLISEIKKWG